MSDERSWLTPYNYCQNNPINFTDIDGRLDDGYTVDKFGNFQRVNDEGGDTYDVIYNKNAYDQGKRDYDGSGTMTGIMIFDKSFIPAMLKIETFFYATSWDWNPEMGFYNGYIVNQSKYDSNVNTKKDQVDNTNYMGLFFFLANNTKVEWSIFIPKKGGYCLGTHRHKMSSVNPGNFRYGAYDYSYKLHSHIERNSIKSEKLSLGSDKTNGKYGTYEVYFPASRRIYNIGKIHKGRQYIPVRKI
jgi:hypothetical protein